MINQAVEKRFSVPTGHPRGNKAAAEHDTYIGELLLEKADHGKGRKGLAQIVEGKANNCCPVVFNNSWQAPAEIRIKGIFRLMFGSVEKILALNRRKARVNIIGKTDTNSLTACHREQAVDIQYRALIGIDILIGLPAAEAVEISGEIAICAAGPGVGRGKRCLKETEHPLEVGIQQGVLDIVSSQRTGEQGNAPRRLRWLGNRGEDQQDLARASLLLHKASL